MPLLTAYERTRQVHGKTLGFFDNNAALSDPRGYTIKKASTSYTPLIDTILGKTVNNLGVSVQAALAVTNPSQYGIVFNSNFYPVVAAPFVDVWLNKLAVVTTLAGEGTGAFLDGTNTAARFNAPFGVAVLPNGNIVVADKSNHRIRLITMPSGTVSTLAGDGTGAFLDNIIGTSARFRYPYGVAALANGNIVVADQGNHRIRLITMPSGAVSTLAGNGAFGSINNIVGTSATFSSPSAVAVLPNGNIVCVDVDGNRIRLITMPGGAVSTLAGDGTTAIFRIPYGIAVLPSGNIVVADGWNHRIREITMPDGVVTTLAGDGTPGFLNGPGASARFRDPYGIAVLPNGNIIVAETSNHSIRLITMPSGVVTTLAGNGTRGMVDGTGTDARFDNPGALAVLPNGSIIIGDEVNNRIRLITPT